MPGKSTVFNAIAGTFLIDDGKIELDGQDITFEKEYKRARMIGRMFQDPLKGTAPNMTIEENLALAYMRGTKHGISMGINKKDRELFREKLAMLNLGLEDRMNDQSRTSIWRPASGSNPAHVYDSYPKTPFVG